MAQNAHTQLPLDICCLGDSISDSVYFASWMWPSVLGRFIPGANVFSCGVTGNMTTDILGTAVYAPPKVSVPRITSQGILSWNYFLPPGEPASQTYWRYNTGRVCFVLIGVNDLLFTNITAAGLWTNLQTIYAQLAAQGFIVCPCTIMPFGGATPNTVTLLQNNATSGSITISYGSSTSAAIRTGSTSTQVASAVAALTGIGTGHCSGSGGPWPASPVTLTCSSVSLTSGFSVSSANLVGDLALLDVGSTPYTDGIRTTVNAEILAQTTYGPSVNFEPLGNGATPNAMQSVYVQSDNIHPSVFGALEMAAIAASVFPRPTGPTLGVTPPVGGLFGRTGGDFQSPVSTGSEPGDSAPGRSESPLH